MVRLRGPVELAALLIFLSCVFFSLKMLGDKGVMGPLLDIVDKFTYFGADLLLYFTSVKLASNKGEIGPREKILAPIQPEGAESESV